MLCILLAIARYMLPFSSRTQPTFLPVTRMPVHLHFIHESEQAIINYMAVNSVDCQHCVDIFRLSPQQVSSQHGPADLSGSIHLAVAQAHAIHSKSLAMERLGVRAGVAANTAEK